MWRLNADAVARPVRANESGVLDWFGFAFNGECGERMIGRINGQAREADAEAILFEFDLIT
jgi:hypothetical protein